MDKDFSDVRVEGLFFAVDPTLRGDRLVIQYDPFFRWPKSSLTPPRGRYVGLGRRYQRKGSHPQPAPVACQPIAPHYLDALRAEHAVMQEQRRSLGIDYRSARQRNVWSLSSFGAFSPVYRVVRAAYPGWPCRKWISWPPSTPATISSHRESAPAGLEQAPAATLPEVLFQLQSLFPERTTDVPRTLATEANPLPNTRWSLPCGRTNAWTKVRRAGIPASSPASWG